MFAMTKVIIMEETPKYSFLLSVKPSLSLSSSLSEYGPSLSDLALSVTLMMRFKHKLLSECVFGAYVRERQKLATLTCFHASPALSHALRSRGHWASLSDLPLMLHVFPIQSA